jgi:hypothetical protein
MLDYRQSKVGDTLKMLKLRLHQAIGVTFIIMGIIILCLDYLNILNSLPNWLALGMTLVFAGVALPQLDFASLVSALFSVGLYFTVKAGRRPLNEIPTFNKTTNEVDAQLQELGFTIWGAFVTEYAPDSEVNGTMWVYVDETQTVYAELLYYPAPEKHGVEIRTEYADGFVLGTLYNVALDVDSPRFQVRSFESLTEAFDYHLYQVSLHTMKHGTPLTFASVEDYLGGAEKEIAEKKVIARDSGIASLRAARWGVLAILVASLAVMLMPNFMLIAGLSLLIVGAAFWIEDFTVPRKTILQTMEQRKKQKL